MDTAEISVIGLSRIGAGMLDGVTAGFLIKDSTCLTTLQPCLKGLSPVSSSSSLYQERITLNCLACLTRSQLHQALQKSSISFNSMETKSLHPSLISVHVMI